MNEKRRGRKVNFEARVPKVYAKLKPFWERFGIETAGHDAIDAGRLLLRRAASAYADAAVRTKTETLQGRGLGFAAADCERAMTALDSAAMQLAAVCELNLARVETQAALDADERARKPRRGRKPSKAKKPSAKRTKKRPTSWKRALKRALEPAILLAEKPAKRSKKKARPSKK